MGRDEHWNQVYRTKSATEVSWFEEEPRVSLELICEASPEKGSVIDVGGGASQLVDRLLEEGFRKVTVLDVSEAGLEIAQARLGARAEEVEWIVADICRIETLPPCDVWHDRAVFHFLIEPEDRRRYVELAKRTILPGGHLIVGGFALEGPLKCSGLEVRRYDAEGLSAELGAHFRLRRGLTITHRTPAQKEQAFFFGIFQASPPHQGGR